jgi:hypothetical protein
MTCMMDMETLRRQQNERHWLLTYGLMHRDRDKHFAAARRLGLTVSEIARLSGMSRQHVSVIISRIREDPGRGTGTGTAAGGGHSSA